MTTATEYRAYGEECLQALKFTTSAEVRAALLSMAERWGKLADFAERAGNIVPDLE